MAFKVKKSRRETSQGLVRRFAKRMRQSGLLMRARRIRFRARPKSEQAKKRAALRREELRKKYEKLEKMGELK